jgi:hypothetical protein
MKRCIVGGLAAVLMAGELIATAPPASAGCQYGGSVISKATDPSSLTAPGNVAWQFPTWCIGAPVPS